MPKYVDGFLFAISRDKLPAYRRMAADAAKIWKKHGALDYKECVSDDLSPEHVTYNFTKAAKAKEGEVVIFSYIVYASKADRNRINKKVMADPGLDKYKDLEMPFDMKRFAYGGFRVIVDA